MRAAAVLACLLSVAASAGCKDQDSHDAAVRRDAMAGHEHSDTRSPVSDMSMTTGGHMVGSTAGRATPAQPVQGSPAPTVTPPTK